MKRRILAWALLCGLLLSACGVSEAEKETLDIYYCAVDGGVDYDCTVVKSVQSIPAGADRLHEALRLLAAEPQTPRLRSALPAGLYIETYGLEDGRISVSLNEGYSALQPIQRTLLCACMVLTLCALEEVRSVSLYEEEQLVETDLTAAAFLRESLPEGETDAEQVFWLPDPERGCLKGETMQVRQWGNVSLTESVLRQLLTELQPYGMPRDTQVLSAARRAGVCTVDLSADFRAVSELSAAELRLLLYSIVNTMTELDAVDTVLFRCEGSSMGICGAMDLSEPLCPEEAFTDRAMADEQNTVVTVYLLGADGQLVPVKAALSAGEQGGGSAAETAIRLLLGLERSWGYQLPFVQGTELLQCTLRDGVAELVLSESFWSGGDMAQEVTASALAATACDAGLRGIRIMTHSGVYRNREILTKNGDKIKNG